MTVVLLMADTGCDLSNIYSSVTGNGLLHHNIASGNGSGGSSDSVLILVFVMSQTMSVAVTLA